MLLKPFAHNGYLRRMPGPFGNWTKYRDFPRPRPHKRPPPVEHGWNLYKVIASVKDALGTGAKNNSHDPIVKRCGARGGSRRTDMKGGRHCMHVDHGFAFEGDVRRLILIDET